MFSTMLLNVLYVIRHQGLQGKRIHYLGAGILFTPVVILARYFTRQLH